MNSYENRKQEGNIIFLKFLRPFAYIV